MFCPQCSQQRASDELRFCSRSEFPLNGVAKLVATGGNLPALDEDMGRSVRSARRRGVQQGVGLMFVGALLLPFVDVISRPYHEALIFVFLLGGILRVLYALAFQEGALFKSRKQKEKIPSSQLGANASEHALPTSEAARLDVGQRRAALVKRSHSIAENTTKLLDEQNNQNPR